MNRQHLHALLDAFIDGRPVMGAEKAISDEVRILDLMEMGVGGT